MNRTGTHLHRHEPERVPLRQYLADGAAYWWWRARLSVWEFLRDGSPMPMPPQRLIARGLEE